jgi:hypothetical protein
MTGKLYRLPFLLLISGCLIVIFTPFISLGDWVILCIGFIFTFGMGLVQGRYNQLINKEGVWRIAGSPLSVFTWLVSIPIKIALLSIIVAYFHIQLHLHGFTGYASYLYSVSGFLLGKYTMLQLRHPTLVKSINKNQQKLKQLRAAG